MSPELIDVETQSRRRTKYSDRYALGMVIYEVLSGRIPFYRYTNWSIPAKVVRGDRPERPVGAEGVWFTDGVWEAMERCWVPQPKNRSNVEDVLRCLEGASRSWVRSPPRQVEVPSTINSPAMSAFEITTEQSVSAYQSGGSSYLHSSNGHEPSSKGDTDNAGTYSFAHELPFLRSNGIRHITSAPPFVPTGALQIPL